MRSPTTFREVLTPAQWHERTIAHQARVDEVSSGHLARSACHEKDPTEDFLWTYYSLRPGQLRQWHPGHGVALLGDAGSYLSRRWYHRVDTPEGPGVTLDSQAFLAARGSTVSFIRDLLAATAERETNCGCFCMHEWAMVYHLRESDTRHPLPLRLGQPTTDAVVEAHAPLRCTHYDAFRFFTTDAQQLNARSLTREQQREAEQPACLHATMDLYKWAYKLLPAVSSELVLECFILARKARDLDMAASPYDTRSIGLEPIPVETARGKATFIACQRGIAAVSAQMRARLIAACDRLNG